MIEKWRQGFDVVLAKRIDRSSELALTLCIAWNADRAGFEYWEGFLMIVVITPALSYLIMKFWAFSHKSPN